jgi:hypothetical protein
MDRLRHVLTGGTLVAILGSVVAASGCRSMHSEVPPGKQYSTTGGTPDLNFNSAPHPNNSIGGGLYNNSGTPGQPGMPGQGSSTGIPGLDGSSSGAGSAPALGTPAPSTSNFGQPTDNRYGGPTGLSPVGAYNPGR